MELSRVTIKYTHIEDLITQLSLLRDNPAIGLYTEIALEKDWNHVYRKEQENEI